MHYSVGAVIKRKSGFLLVDRLKIPHGYAGIAGHIDEGETHEEALFREVLEESGLTVVKYSLLYEEETFGKCSRGINVHHWYLFECEVKGRKKLKSDEARSIGYYSKKEISQLPLEPVWEHWFKKLGVLK